MTVCRVGRSVECWPECLQISVIFNRLVFSSCFRTLAVNFFLSFCFLLSEVHSYSECLLPCQWVLAYPPPPPLPQLHSPFSGIVWLYCCFCIVQCPIVIAAPNVCFPLQAADSIVLYRAAGDSTDAAGSGRTVWGGRRRRLAGWYALQTDVQRFVCFGSPLLQKLWFIYVHCPLTLPLSHNLKKKKKKV